eukprot:SAG22_NODE_797_length_7135_cov_211.841103_1_plen_91_part_00
MRDRECPDEPLTSEMQYVHYFYSKLRAAAYEKPRYRYPGRFLDLVMVQVERPLAAQTLPIPSTSSCQGRKFGGMAWHQQQLCIVFANSNL